jgi:hypothetical protein
MVVIKPLYVPFSALCCPVRLLRVASLVYMLPPRARRVRIAVGPGW